MEPSSILRSICHVNEVNTNESGREAMDNNVLANATQEHLSLYKYMHGLCVILLHITDRQLSRWLEASRNQLRLFS